MHDIFQISITSSDWSISKMTACRKIDDFSMYGSVCLDSFAGLPDVHVWDALRGEVPRLRLAPRRDEDPPDPLSRPER